MKRSVLFGGAALVLTSTFAFAAPESLLPPGFDNPVSPPTPTVTAASTSRPTVVPPTPGSATSAPVGVVQSIPDQAGEPSGPVALPTDFPSLAEIEEMNSDEIDELLGLKPKFDIPAAARRSLTRIGVIAQDEGGFPAGTLAKQPASLVRAALQGTKSGPVSRWGHILLRRTLASRLDAPDGMEAAEFATLRAALLVRMGEGYAARALVQDVDSSNYTSALTDAAFDAYLATGDIVGMCPVARLKGGLREDPQWQMLRSICIAYNGHGREASRELNRALSGEVAPRIDVLMAQRYAGAAWDGGRAVNIEWEGVSTLTPWRYSLGVSLGVEIPDTLRRGAGPFYDRFDAVSPALPLARRAAAADIAGREGILSSSAMVDLYGQIYADDQVTGETSMRASRLREAYVGRDANGRMQAIRDVWGMEQPAYGRLVLTAYAAARLPASGTLVDDATPLIASMLSAGLDRNAMLWSSAVPEGSAGWAMLALAQPTREGMVSADAIDSFYDDDTSIELRKTRFLVAGLAGLGRLSSDTISDMSDELGINLTRESAWSRMINRAAQHRNPTLVALLAGLGMQGDGWDKMTARHLYLIVRSLNQVGLSAEARMIAAEAVARG